MADEYIPEPTLVIMGCRAWPPPPEPGQKCPVCKGGIVRGDNDTQCGLCNSASPLREHQVRSARIGVKTRDKAEAAERMVREDLQELRKGVQLDESTRRRIWNGYRGGIHASNPNVTNEAKLCRDFLIEIGQVPDWSLEIKVRRRRSV
jgi:hypothetical protein